MTMAVRVDQTLAEPRAENGTTREARWDERYSVAEYVFGKNPSAFLLRNAHRLKPGQRALAIGDGEGRNGVWLARQGLFVHSVDLSTVALDKARRLAVEQEVSIRFEKADILSWDWPVERYHLIVAIFLHFLSPAQQAPLFKRVRDALKPNGLFLLHGYAAAQAEYRTGGPDNTHHLYTPSSLEAAVGNMEIIELKEYEETLSEGSRHVGRSALVDLVARRRD
jgi:SAM-dependent methyltransferase